jgi:CheY-like chemotaxis protein
MHNICKMVLNLGRTLRVAVAACRSAVHVYVTLRRWFGDCAVTVARNGQEALDILRDDEEKIDLILTDIMMPQVSHLPRVGRATFFCRTAATTRLALKTSLPAGHGEF